jgi:hypothetical protein
MAVMIAPAAPSESRAKELIPDKTVVSAYIETIDIRLNKAGDAYYLSVKVNTVDTCPWPDRWLYGMVSLKDTARWSANAFLLATPDVTEADLAGQLCFYDGTQEDPPTPEGDVFVVDINDLIGTLVDVQVSQETYNGETRNKVGRFLRNRTVGLAAADTDELPF